MRRYRMYRGAFLLVLLGLFTFVSAQSKVSFSYDVDGNVIQRRTVTLVKSSSKVTPKQEAPKTDIKRANRVRIFPNPTRGVVRLEIDSLSAKALNRVVLYSTQGNPLIDRKIESGSVSLDLSSFTAGIYLLDLHLGKEVQLFKIIKQ